MKRFATWNENKIAPIAGATAILCLAALWFSGNGSFVADDLTHILNAEYLQHLPSLAEIWKGLGRGTYDWGYRPIVSLSYYLEGKIGLAEPFPMRVVNLCIHLANGLLLFLIVRQERKSAPQDSWPALLAVALFVFHPVSAKHATINVDLADT